MQDFTGVPAVVDLAAMRDAMVALGGDPNKINPQALKAKAKASVKGWRSRSALASACSLNSRA